MKILTVYHLDGKWYGSEVDWARSGSGFYRQTKLIDVPQTRDAIVEFAREHVYKIQWREPIPAEPATV